MCSIDRGNIEGTNSSKIGLMFDVYECVVFVSVCMHRDWFCGLTWEMVYIYIHEKSFEM